MGGGFTSLSWAPLVVANRKGFARELGLELDLTEVPGDAAQLAALRSGEIDFAGPKASTAIEYKVQLADAMSVYAMVKQFTMHTVVSKSFMASRGIDPQAGLQERVRKLKGITLGAPSLGGATETYSRWVLTRSGLSNDDISVVKVGGGSALVAAMENNQIDGFVQSPPAPQEAVLRGAGVVIVRPSDIPELSRHVGAVVATTRAYAEKNPTVVQRLLAALDRSKRFIHEDFDGAVALLKRDYPNVADESLRESLKYFREAYGTDGRMDAEAWTNTLTLLKQGGELKGPPDPAEGFYWTNRYQ